MMVYMERSETARQFAFTRVCPYYCAKHYNMTTEDITIEDLVLWYLEYHNIEIWKDIYFFNKRTNEWIDYRGLYQVSNFGRLRSVDHYVRGFNHNKEFERLSKGQILKLRPNWGGYTLAHLAKEGKHRDYSLHRLIYFSFNPEADTLLEVNHIDEDITNNFLSNLNLLTSKENTNWGTRNKHLSDGIREVRKKKFWNSKSKTSLSA